MYFRTFILYVNLTIREDGLIIGFIQIAKNWFCFANKGQVHLWFNYHSKGKSSVLLYFYYCQQRPKPKMCLSSLNTFWLPYPVCGRSHIWHFSCFLIKDMNQNDWQIYSFILQKDSVISICWGLLSVTDESKFGALVSISDSRTVSVGLNQNKLQCVCSW